MKTETSEVFCRPELPYTHAVGIPDSRKRETEVRIRNARNLAAWQVRMARLRHACGARIYGEKE